MSTIMNADLKVGDTIELSIERLAHGGEGIGRHVDGRAVFVRGALPGDTVLATVEQVKKRFLKAVASQIVAAGELRVDSRCPAAAVGAGCCDFATVDPSRELGLKTEILRGQLKHLAGLEEIPALHARTLEPIVGWRTRTRLGVDASGHAGLRKVRSAELVTEYPCSQNVPGLLDGIVGPGSRTFTPGAEVIVVRDDAGNRTVVEVRKAGRGRRAETITEVLEGTGTVMQVAGEAEFSFPATAFWQAHVAAPREYSALIEQWVAELAAPGSTPVAWDLYGGVGLFNHALDRAMRSAGLGSAEKPAEIHSVDYSEAAQEAQRSVVHAGGAEVYTHRGKVEGIVAQLPAPSVVVLDPPRVGAGDKVVSQIAAAGPEVAIHIGCDPATFARDMKSWVENGYEIARLELLDAFPGTHHFEVIAALQPAARSSRRIKNRGGGVSRKHTLHPHDARVCPRCG